MKRFLTLSLLFLIPIALLLGPPAYILWKSKENFYNPDELIKSGKPYLIGYAYHEENYGYLKWANLKLKDKQTVLALGSSRVLQFREQMFDSSFYNAGYTITGLNEMIPFLNSVSKEKYPNYIIIGLDQWMFNPAWDKMDKTPKADKWEKSFEQYPDAALMVQLVYKDLFAGKYGFSSFNQTAPPIRIGLNAFVNDKGFRQDGSMYYGNQISKLLKHDTTANDYGFANTYHRIEKGNMRFEYGDHINPKALAELNTIIAFCVSNKIKPILFIPPFAGTVYQKMLKTNRYGYLKEIWSPVKLLAAKHHVEAYDFTDINSIGSSDAEALDGFHGSEVTYQRLLIKMLESGSVLNKTTSVARLKMDLEQRKNQYLIYK